jgi:hypothetical protein
MAMAAMKVVFAEGFLGGELPEKNVSALGRWVQF